MKYTKADIKHKAEKIAMSLIRFPIIDIDYQAVKTTQDLICTMGLKKAKKTRVQITKDLKQLKENIMVAKRVMLKVNKLLLKEDKRRKTYE